MEDKHDYIESEVTITGVTRELFERAMEVIWLTKMDYPDAKVKGYYIENNTLYLCSYYDKMISFPYPYNLRQTIEFIWGWLENTEPDYEEPNTDGSTEKAWLIDTTNCDWHDSRHGTDFSIRRIWFIYGK